MATPLNNAQQIDFLALSTLEQQFIFVAQLLMLLQRLANQNQANATQYMQLNPDLNKNLLYVRATLPLLETAILLLPTQQVLEVFPIVASTPVPPPTPVPPTPVPPPTPALVTYTATALDGQTFAGANNLPALYDGNPNATDIGSQIRPNGFTANCPSCAIKLMFAQPTTIKKLRISPGQVNGPYNQPDSLTLYVGTGTNQVVYTVSNPFTDNDFYTFKEFDLSANTASSSTYRLDLTSATGSISVFEMQVIGY